MAKTKWKYSVPNPDLIARAMSILYGENEQIWLERIRNLPQLHLNKRIFMQSNK